MIKEARLETLRDLDQHIHEVFDYYILLKTQELIDQKYTSETTNTLNTIGVLIEERARLIAEGLAQ